MTRPLTGSVPLPADKSIAHRALLLAALARGKSRIVASAPGEDNAATAAALRAMGVEVDAGPKEIVVAGAGLHGLSAPSGPIDCGNSAPYRGEIIAAGPAMDRADAAMDAWLKSETHHREMLNPHYRVAGVSRFYHPASTYGWYWVVDFASE